MRFDWKDVATYLLAIVASAITLTPIIWMTLTAFKRRIDIFTMPPKLLFTVTLENFDYAFFKSPFLVYFKNSLIVSTASTAVTLLVGLPAAYGIYRFNFRFKEGISIIILFTRILPAIVFAIPFFVFFMQLGWINAYPSVIFMHLIMNLPIVVWLMGGFIEGIPKDFEESAMIDGCTRLGAFLRIILPIVATGLAPIAIVAFLFSWNELLFALVLTGPETKTMPVGILNYIGYGQIEWGPLCAAALTATLPTIIFAMFTQRYLLRGITAGVIKG